MAKSRKGMENIGKDIQHWGKEMKQSKKGLDKSIKRIQERLQVPSNLRIQSIRIKRLIA